MKETYELKTSALMDKQMYIGAEYKAQHFLISIIYKHGRWYHKLLFFINKRFVNTIPVEIVYKTNPSSRLFDYFGLKLYGKTYWMNY